MIKPQQVVEVVCDADPECDYWKDSDSGVTPLFADEAEARKACEDWRWKPDGTVVCPVHASREDCAALGHDWQAWRDCGCNGRIAPHAAAGCPQIRYCDRDHCWERQEKPAVPA